MANYVRYFSTSLIMVSAVWLSPGHAAVGEITIDGEVVPASLFVTFEERKLLPNQQCSPISDAYVRDQVINHWLSVKDGRARKWRLKDYTVETLEELKDEINSATAQSSATLKARKELDALQTESFAYSSDYRSANISDDDAIARYKERITDKDATLINVPVVKFKKVQFVKGSGDMQKFVAALSAGKSWEALMEPLSGFARNNDKGDEWHTIPALDEYNNATVQRLVGDGSELKVGDVIGPIEMFAYSQIFRIDAKMIWPVISSGDRMNGTDSWGLESSKQELRQRYFRKVNADLRAGLDIRENGEPVEVIDDYPVCDSAG